ncbi:MAG TPA: hypothetical protein DCP28_20650, partial [Cytophagales bacterium]|nr:hypothetical protein [Cytophagales bacterium]
MRHAQDQMKKITGGLRRVCRLLLILGLTAAGAMAQTVSGVVTEADGTPMVGVNVAIKGTSRGVTTNLDGQYKVEVASDATLIFSFIGFLGQEIAVDGRTAINVTMELDIETLNEVVVVGYGVQKKSDLTGAIASVDRDNLQQLATTSPMQALQGQESGV